MQAVTINSLVVGERYLFTLNPASGFNHKVFATVSSIIESHILLKNIKENVTNKETEMFDCPIFWIVSVHNLSSDAGRKKRSLKARNSKRRIRKSKRFRRR